MHLSNSLADGLAHALSSPLLVVRSELDLHAEILDGVTPAKPLSGDDLHNLRDTGDRARDALDRLDTLATVLQLLAAPDAGPPRSCSVRELVALACQWTEQTGQRPHRVSFSARLPTPEPTLLLPVGKTMRLLVHVLGSAAATGPVGVTLRPAGQGVDVTLRAPGWAPPTRTPGMPRGLVLQTTPDGALLSIRPLLAWGGE